MKENSLEEKGPLRKEMFRGPACLLQAWQATRVSSPACLVKAMVAAWAILLVTEIFYKDLL